MNNFAQALLKFYTPEQLGIIQQTRIGIAGVGGLGSNIAQILVRSGFIYLELVDKDAIETSNLNRQNYYWDEIGKSKVNVTAERLRSINPDVQVRTAEVHLVAENINTCFQDCQIICEAFDNEPSKVLMLEAFGNSGKLLVFGNGMAGISTQPEIKIRKYNENVYLVGDGRTAVSENNPPLAPRVIACAALMAGVVLEKTLTGKVAQQ